jgi:acyl carrier protein
MTEYPVTRPGPDEASRFVEEAILRIVPDAEMEDLAADTPIRGEFELDSLDFLSFVDLLSTRTGVRIDEVNYPQLATMTSCVDFLTGSQ